MKPKIRALLLAATAGTLLLSSACSSGGDDATEAGGKVELTFWSWVPGIDKVVAQWNAAHPDIHVTVSKQAQGDEEVTKVLTANKAGNPPDLFQAEYQALPTLVSNGAAAGAAWWPPATSTASRCTPRSGTRRSTTAP
ncbi:extracellular solute-binding protein [Dactylosporangium sp. NPDC050688]|uniref:ABC transporter substrate-binding protein n=1 Tax=Dactylosporangium sp. NPDC050688 TaxID=3157217 RepID=UPI0033EFDB70